MKTSVPLQGSAHLQLGEETWPEGQATGVQLLRVGDIEFGTFDGEIKQ